MLTLKLTATERLFPRKTVDEKRPFMRKILEEAADRWQIAPDPTAEEKRRVRLTFTFRNDTKASGFDSTTVFYPLYKIEVRNNTDIKTSTSY